MDKRKDIQALDDESLDQVSGGIELTTMISRHFGKSQMSSDGLVYKGEKVQSGGLVYRSGTGNGPMLSNLTGQPTAIPDSEENVLTSL